MREKIEARNRRWFPGQRAAHEEYIAELQVILPRGSLVCHLGAGRDSLEICPHLSGSRIVSVDVDIPGLRSNPGRRRVAADGAALPFKDHLFDAVMADNVLEHLKRPEAVLREISRSLKPEGAFVFLCPNRNSYISWVSSLTPHWFHAVIKRETMGVKRGDVFPTYYRMNTSKAIRRVADRAGFRVEKIMTFVGWPTYWEYSDLLHRIFVVVHKALEFLPSWCHITLVGVLRK